VTCWPSFSRSGGQLRPINEDVLDSSIILAILKNETIDDSAYAVVPGAVTSAVNVAEVYSKLGELDGISLTQVELLLGLLARIEPFNASQAKACGMLRDATRNQGMSLGDRACIALAMDLDATVYTTDRQWATATLACRVKLLR
jgi:PIN domain nuclease of toxin-antitoxin system